MAVLHLCVCQGLVLCMLVCLTGTLKWNRAIINVTSKLFLLWQVTLSAIKKSVSSYDYCIYWSDVSSVDLFWPFRVHRCCRLVTVCGLSSIRCFFHSWYLLIWHGWLCVWMWRCVFLCTGLWYLLIWLAVPFMFMCECHWARACAHSCDICSTGHAGRWCVCEVGVCHEAGCLFNTFNWCNIILTQLTLGVLSNDGGHKFITQGNETGFKSKAAAMAYIDLLAFH